MSGIGITEQNLPQFISQKDFEHHISYFELMSLILTQWFNSNGFYLPTLTDAQVTTMVAQYGSGPWPIKQWYNSDQVKLQFLDATGAVQTVTSV
jgi:hypothetical protein